MIKNIIHNSSRAAATSTLRFRKWSRKGYAVFRSLGKEVTIGRLTVSIEDSSLMKMEKAGSFAVPAFSEGTISEGVDEREPSLVLSELSDCLISVVNLNSDAAAQRLITLIILLWAGKVFTFPALFV